MDRLASPLFYTLKIRSNMERGAGVKTAIQKSLAYNKADDFALELKEFLWVMDCGESARPLFLRQTSLYRRTLLELLEMGIQGAQIGSRLQALEEEMRLACLRDIDRQLALLPLISLAPLLGLQFPALMCLLVSPFIYQFIRGIS